MVGNSGEKIEGMRRLEVIKRHLVSVFPLKVKMFLQTSAIA